MKCSGGRLLNYFSYHIKQSKTSYLLISICLLIGITLGIVLHFTSSIGAFFLSDGDQQIFDFVTKDVSLVKFIFTKEGNLLLAFIILFACCLSVYSSFLGYAFFAYQGFIFAASCCQIISTFGLLGIINVVVILIPINLALFGIMAYFTAVSIERALLARKYKMSFKSSFAYKQYYWREICFSVLFGVLFVIIVGVICGIVLQSVSFVVF